MKKKPTIGIVLDSQKPGGYSRFPWYALRQNYAESVSFHGGVPLYLPYDHKAIPAYLEMLDGILFPGGDFDIPPSLYGAKTQHKTVKPNPQRTGFEIALLKEALKKNMPILGICGGEQLINVAMGGTLIQHIPAEVPNCLKHEQGDVLPTKTTQTVRVEKETLLYRLVKKQEIQVNTTHHQAAKKPGKGVMVNAMAEDGIIEGIECPEYRFCLGVQWHPEYGATPEDGLIIGGFIKSAANKNPPLP